MLMKAFPNYPSQNDLSLQELFEQETYKSKTKEQQNDIKLKSAMYRYEYEKERCFFKNYFPKFDTAEFRGSTALDLGCFTGGRLVFWQQKFGFDTGYGIDVNSNYKDAGEAFARKKEVNAHFHTGVGESLPYESDFFDYIISFDVFEHVQNVEKVCQECFRVLKPGGKLLVAFPQFYQPFEAHLGLVTKLPILHWIFPSRILSEAYCEILEERGEQAKWYGRSLCSEVQFSQKSYGSENVPRLEGWEKLPSLNGITVAKFREIIQSNKSWEICYQNKKPILTDGKKSEQWIFRLLSKLFYLPARMPVLEELFLSRVCFILKAGSHLK